MIKLGPDTYVFRTNGHSALLASSRLILVDTGTKPDASILLDDLKNTGYKAKDIEHIVITHTHPDHVGGLHHMKEVTDATIAAHHLEAKYISKEEVYQGPPGAASQRHPGTHVDKLLEDGEVYEGLLVIHTPGHTPGHIALLDTERSILFAGDSLRNDPSGLAPMPNQYNIDPTQHLQSIRKLANYNFDKVIVGHGDPVSQGAHERLKQLVKTLD